MIATYQVHNHIIREIQLAAVKTPNRSHGALCKTKAGGVLTCSSGYRETSSTQMERQLILFLKILIRIKASQGRLEECSLKFIKFRIKS